MRPEERDAAYLWDMRDAVETVISFAKGKPFETCLRDRQMQLAAERALEIIREAGRHVSPQFRHAHAGLPWTGMIGLRHILAHECGRMKHERIWKIIEKDVPELLRVLPSLLPPLPPPGQPKGDRHA